MSTISLYRRPSRTLVMLHTACGLLPIVTPPPLELHTLAIPHMPGQESYGETQTWKASQRLRSQLLKVLILAVHLGLCTMWRLRLCSLQACIYYILITYILHQSLFVSCLGTCTRQRCASRPYILSRHISRH